MRDTYKSKPFSAFLLLYTNYLNIILYILKTHYINVVANLLYHILITGLL